MKLLLLCVYLTIAGCASVHPGNKGNELNHKKMNDLIVSAERVNEFSDPTLSFISITMENKSDKWIKINNTDFNCGEKCNKKVSIIVGDDLLSWAKAKKDQMDLKKHNEKIFLGGLTAGGLLLSILSHNEDLMMSGIVVAGAGAVTNVITDLNRDKIKLESNKWVPEEHVFSNISVPTSLFPRKWILVSHQKGFDIGAFILKFKTIEDEELKYLIKI